MGHPVPNKFFYSQASEAVMVSQPSAETCPCPPVQKLITYSELGVSAILTLSCRSGLAPAARRSSTSLWWP